MGRTAVGVLLVGVVLSTGYALATAPTESNQSRSAKRAIARQLIAKAIADASLIPDEAGEVTGIDFFAADKISAYCLISEAQVKAGDNVGALKSLEAASEAAAKIEGDGYDGYKAYTDCKILAAKINTGDVVSGSRTPGRGQDRSR